MLSVLAALVGFGFSAYLTYLELFTIDAVCQWCVASAVAMTRCSPCFRLAPGPPWRLTDAPLIDLSHRAHTFGP